MHRTTSQAQALSPGSAPPSALGKYAPFASLGRGGMADVFLAVARGPVGFHKLAVVKRLRGSDEVGHLEMFLDEARLSSRLSHPNIVNTYEVGEAHGQYFIAMEYLEGQALHSVLSDKSGPRGPLDEAVAAFVAMQALKALHYAHELKDYDGSPLQIVHRDVSPHNLFITYQGEIKLIDFGIAKASVNVTHTETGVLKGKVRYMAPEQIASPDIDRRADVFALGIVLWEMLTGRALFSGDISSIVDRMTMADVPPVRSVREDVSPELEAIVAKALRRDILERYEDADKMRADLDAFLRGKSTSAEAALARLMTETFAETREAVRTRIKTFLAELPSGSTSVSVRDLARTETLPTLFDNETPRNAGASKLLDVTGGATSSSRKPLWRAAVAGAAVLVTAGVIALSKKSAPPPAPEVASKLPAAAATTGSDPVREAPPPTSDVHVDSVPSGALVEWRGQPLARTPADVQLSTGAQVLRITNEGYEPEVVPIDVKSQARNAINVVLRTSASAVARPAAAGARPTRRVAPPSKPPPAPATASAVIAPTPTPTASQRPANIRIVEDEAP